SANLQQPDSFARDSSRLDSSLPATCALSFRPATFPFPCRSSSCRPIKCWHKLSMSIQTALPAWHEVPASRRPVGLVACRVAATSERTAVTCRRKIPEPSPCTGSARRIRTGSTVATPLETWVEEAARLTKPDRIVYCDGSADENQRVLFEMLREGDSETLNEKTYPNCYLHRSSPNDVARTEHLTFICSNDKNDAGPTNN